MLDPAVVLALLVAAAPPGPTSGRDNAPSPRSAVAHYLDRCSAGDWEGAARLLELTPGLEERGPELARHLKAVLDRRLWIDLGAVSDAPEGDRSDGLAPDLEDLGTIARTGGGSDPVRLVRAARDGRAWRFAAATVARIDAWYASMGTGWILDRLPPSLARAGPGGVAWWQWIAIPVLALLAWLVAVGAARATLSLVAHVTSRTAARWDDELVDRLPGPTRLAWALALLAAGLRLLELPAPAQRFADAVLRTGAAATFFWALLRAADILGQVAARSPWAGTHPASRSLLPIAVRAGKVAIAALAVVEILALWGVPVASLVAGLGIGGLALALAAQKTVENLFGSFSIGVDQPFREGDFVKVDDVLGTVEAIGLRSTRIRTLDRTIVTLPNGKLADTRVESFTARDRIRLACTLSLVYGTTAAQMRAILQGLEGVLRGHPKIWQEAVVVRFRELAASSLDVEVMAWFRTSDFGEFQAFRQEVLLAFMEVVERAGSAFAFPTRTVHLHPTPRSRRAPGDGVEAGAREDRASPRPSSSA